MPRPARIAKIRFMSNSRNFNKDKNNVRISDIILKISVGSRPGFREKVRSAQQEAGAEDEVESHGAGAVEGFRGVFPCGKMPAHSGLDKEGAEAELRKLSADSRISAEPMIIIKEKDELFEHVLSRVSGVADVVFLGLNTPEKGEEEDYAKKLEIFAEPLKAVFFIKNSGIFQGQLLETGDEKNR